MAMDNMNDLFVDELQDLYSAENQHITALPKMARAANNAELRNAIEMHLRQTEEHAHRIEEIFNNGLQGSPGHKTCEAMEGLIKESKTVMEERGAPDVRDAALIGAAQRVEHYEMAGYGTVRTYAQLLGEKNAVKLLQQTLDEEGDADKKLTQLAERINVLAEQPVGR